MRVYLSSPYEHDRAPTSWKDDAYRIMHAMDKRIHTIDPCPDTCKESAFIDEMIARQDWLGVHAFCANIVEGDLAMLNGCEGMIAYLPAGARTVGTIHEIIHSEERRIPIVLVCPQGVDKVSHWLWGLLGPTRLFDNLQDAAETLVKRMQVARGEKINGEVYYPSGQEASR